MMTLKRLVLSAPVVFLGLLAGGCSGDDDAPMTVVPQVDVKQYVGTWNEIASIPVSFQEDCVANTTATYSENDDGTIKVVNRCEQADGSYETADGKAEFAGEGTEGKLRVSFVSVLGIQLWFAGGDYWILALDEDYQWSLVGNPSRDYAWILAREKSVPMATLEQLNGVLVREGYDACRLLITSAEQAPDRPTLCSVVGQPG